MTGHHVNQLSREDRITVTLIQALDLDDDVIEI